jgi:hypothetical protein
MNDQIQVPISSEAWFNKKNNYFYLSPQDKGFFPDDCFIARGTGTENKELLATRGIDIEYAGSAEAVRCFMELRNDGKFRPSNRGSIAGFYRANPPKVGDVIVVSKQSERRYRVSLSESPVGA